MHEDDEHEDDRHPLAVVEQSVWKRHHRKPLNASLGFLYHRVDEEKAKRNGYNVDDLYDCVGKYAEQMGNVRIGLGTWQAKNREVQFGAQCPVCATLSKQPWVMQNIKSWRTYEDMNEPEGEDYLQVIRDISPERIYD